MIDGKAVWMWVKNLAKIKYHYTKLGKQAFAQGEGPVDKSVQERKGIPSGEVKSCDDEQQNSYDYK